MRRSVPIGGVCRGNLHVFPWVEVRKTTEDEGETVVITTYYEAPKTCECGIVKEKVFRETGA